MNNYTVHGTRYMISLFDIHMWQIFIFIIIFIVISFVCEFDTALLRINAFKSNVQSKKLVGLYAPKNKCKPPLTKCIWQQIESQVV